MAFLQYDSDSSELSETFSIPIPDTAPLRNRALAPDLRRVNNKITSKSVRLASEEPLASVKPSRQIEDSTIGASVSEPEEHVVSPETSFQSSHHVAETGQEENKAAMSTEVGDEDMPMLLPLGTDSDLNKPYIEANSANDQATITAPEILPQVSNLLPEERTVHQSKLERESLADKQSIEPEEDTEPIDKGEAVGESTYTEEIADVPDRKVDDKAASPLGQTILPISESSELPDEDTNGRRLGKRKRDILPDIPPFNFEPPYTPATKEEKENWGGFCELESDPGVFNNVLRGFGVEGVKVVEVLGLDEDLLDFIPKPVHGLIFLFQYATEEDEGEADDQCPSHVWFANQVVDNCCGSIAMLNVVNNISPSVLIVSEDFTKLKEFTSPFTPAFRGDQVANCKFIKKAHNAYARTIDMLNADLLLDGNWEAGKKKSKARSGRGGYRRNTKKKLQDDAPFHFVAYMPIDGEMWRMDGLDSFPQNLGAVVTGRENWLQEIAPMISARMAAYSEDGVQFSLMAMVPDEAAAPRFEFIQNVQLLRAIEDRLQSMDKDWRQFSEDAGGNAITAPSADFPFLEQHLARRPDEDMLIRLSKFDDLTTLMELHRKTAQQQVKLRADLTDPPPLDEDTSREEMRALDRQNDYVPFIQKWLYMLADNQELKDLVEAH